MAQNRKRVVIIGVRDDEEGEKNFPSVHEMKFTSFNDLNYEILATVLKNPQRYIGLFRITSAKTKLIQNLTQSCEIKIGVKL